jgi:hypothetical protein
MKTSLKSFLVVFLSVFLLFLGYIFGFTHGSIIAMWNSSASSTSHQLDAAKLLRKGDPHAALHLLEESSVDSGIFMGTASFFPLFPLSFRQVVALANPANIISNGQSSLHAVQQSGDDARDYAFLFPDYAKNAKLAEQGAAANP